MAREYLIKGIKYDSVTTVLNLRPSWPLLFWYGKHGTKWCSKEKARTAQLGRDLHDLIELYLRKKPILHIRPELELTFERFVKWAKKVDLCPIEIEYTVVDEDLGVVGTPDFFGFVEGKLTWVDWKTGSGIYEDHLVQLATYKKMYEKMHPAGIPKCERLAFGHFSVKTGESDFRVLNQKDPKENANNLYRSFLCTLYNYRLSKGSVFEYVDPEHQVVLGNLSTFKEDEIQ